LSIWNEMVYNMEEILVYSQNIRKQAEPFIKGPIPLSWLQKAAIAGSNALEAGLVIWYKAGMSKGEPVKLGNLDLVMLSGKSKDAGRRALQALEGARLVDVDTQPGRKHLIRIIVDDKVIE